MSRQSSSSSYRSTRSFCSIHERAADAITVSRRKLANGAARYDLVCGEGRIEVFQALGQTRIPAIVLELSEEDCLVRSIVENVARPQHRGVDLMREVGAMRKRGYTDAQIAEKIGVTP